MRCNDVVSLDLEIPTNDFLQTSSRYKVFLITLLLLFFSQSLKIFILLLENYRFPLAITLTAVPVSRFYNSTSDDPTSRDRVIHLSLSLSTNEAFTAGTDYQRPHPIRSSSNYIVTPLLLASTMAHLWCTTPAILHPSR
jgi:hypothetical protein